MFSPWQISWSTKKDFTFVRWSPDNWITSPTSSSLCTAPLQLKFFLKALQIRFTSKSSASPATVVIHFRPFRCCTRTWTFSSEFPAPLSPASSNASANKEQQRAQLKWLEDAPQTPHAAEPKYGVVLTKRIKVHPDVLLCSEGLVGWVLKRERRRLRMGLSRLVVRLQEESRGVSSRPPLC